MRFITLLLFAAIGITGPAVNAAPKSFAAKEAAAKADVKEFGAWGQKLTASQSIFMPSVEAVWQAFDALDRVPAGASEAEHLAAMEAVMSAVAKAKADIAEGRETVTALPKLDGNVVLTTLPPDHTEKMRSNTLMVIDGFAEVMDQADTLITAVAAGQPELAKEFGELMGESSGKVISGLRLAAQTQLVMVGKGSINTEKLGIVERNYEAMEALFNALRRAGRGEPADVDTARLIAIGDEINQMVARGRVLLAVEKKQRNKTRAATAPDLNAVIDAVDLLNSQWFDYAAGLQAEFATFPARLEAAEDVGAELDRILTDLGKTEEEYSRHAASLMKVLAEA